MNDHGRETLHGIWAGPEGHQTERLIIRDAVPADAGEIGEIYRSCSYMEEWTGMPHDDASLASLLDCSDLPPGGSREYNHLVVLRERQSGAAVGLCQYYTAWPEAGCMWIGLFLLRQESQRNGYGREFISAFMAECSRQRYRQAGLGVALGNIPALKFWTGLGFVRVVKVVAEGEGGSGVKPMLSLAKEL